MTVVWILNVEEVNLFGSESEESKRIRQNHGQSYQSLKRSVDVKMRAYSKSSFKHRRGTSWKSSSTLQLGRGSSNWKNNLVGSIPSCCRVDHGLTGTKSSKILLYN